ncbi:UDP-N-acetylmuramate:L-alanyl-gamma-D-glutamyl-meso-diaminopimelate ligase [Aestuariibacter salexigens]|uniref:UDP-N-acetylmuramate:L-alanyl-gamma-D-glutamyl- meso-diaminopimelate ligase n=1 Tax=Aestuariibacter salexigens TaxID=226010 RepID=UPI0003F5F001|nr:UDP-N-acetylmuramate:L-alanyl-gamma-D-glutamyl-meso-diaminopimelate ligase [Aestuariibacter salexigens]
MHIHILGICGTFMGGIAAIARQLGHTVTGSDKNVYPPMSTQLRKLGIQLHEGYDIDQFEPAPDMVVIGNALSRGNPAVEYVLNRNLPYTSGPQWLLDNVLKDKWVLAASGTHGKTTTASMLAWILDYADMQPGFLIGGIPQNFDVSARLGDSSFFVIEADEYDSAFFDKRSKFVHYRPRTLILNNLEFDHADIFPDLKAIQTQFHHLLRMVPGNGKVIYPSDDTAIDEVVNMGCWSDISRLGEDWQYRLDSADGRKFTVHYQQQSVANVEWSLLGTHNVHNAVMAIAAAHHVGVPANVAARALELFRNAKRRMELRASIESINVYDDFAHHPTAIKTTLEGLRANVGDARILAVLEPRSNTMKMGIHKDSLASSWQCADEVFVYEPAQLGWSMRDAIQGAVPASLFRELDALGDEIVANAQPGDHILIMSNGGFGGLHDKVIRGLEHKYANR